MRLSAQRASEIRVIIQALVGKYLRTFVELKFVRGVLESQATQQRFWLPAEVENLGGKGEDADAEDRIGIYNFRAESKVGEEARSVPGICAFSDSRGGFGGGDEQ